MSCIFYVYTNNAKRAKETKILNCGHKVIKGDTYYDVYAYEEAYSELIMVVCANCVILGE